MLSAGTAVGPYTILAPLGAGGMGEVYRARDARLGRDVALKIILEEFARDPGRISRFEQEARAAGALNHPNVCAIFDIGNHGGSPFVVMELLEGESLRARLNSGPISARKAMDWTAQAARGLAAAHAKGIVHRDLKPENLFLTRDGRLKVLDFGLAKLTRPDIIGISDTAPLSVPPTATGTILGTAGYMAPEQVTGAPIDQRADIFALGAILYELLTGKRAFAGNAFYEMTYRIVNDDPPPLGASGRDVPAGVEAVVRQCLEKRPEERFQASLDLAFALESVAFSSSGPASFAPAGDVTNRRRRPARLIAMIALGVAVLGLGFLAGTARRRAPETTAEIPSYERLTVDRGRVFSARFAFEGKSIVYAAAWRGQPVELYEVRPGLIASRAIGIEGANLLSVSRGGIMAITLGQDNFTGWAKAGTLAEAPLPDGQPRRILDDVLAGDWAPDGQVLAVSHSVGGKARLEMPPGRTLYESTGQLGCVRVSPSGEWVAFVENPMAPDTRGSVVIMDREGRVSARTGEWNVMQGIAWSADGSEAWFSATQEGAVSELGALSPGGAQRIVDRFPGYMVLHDIAPGGQVLLAREHLLASIRGRQSDRDEERELGWLDWSTAYDISKDGRTVLFDEQGVGGGTYYAFCLRGVNGSAPVKLGEGHGFALSPDGRTVLVGHFGVPNRLLLVPTGPGEAVTMPRGTIQKYLRARWLPDGRGFVFMGAEEGRPWRTWRQDTTAGADPRAVTPEGIAGVTVSPDGRFVAACDQEQQLFIFPLDEGEPTVAARLRPDELVLQWTTDGRALFLGEKGPSMRVTRLDLRTGRREPAGSFELSDSAGTCVWNANLTPDGAGYAYSYMRWLDELYLVEGLK